MPIYVSGIQLHFGNPLKDQSRIGDGSVFDRLRKMVIIITLTTITIAFPILNPVLLMNAYEVEKEKLKYIVRESEEISSEDLAKVDELKRKIDRIRAHLGKYLSNELNFEVIIELVLQITMLFLHRTTTATTGGLETIIGSNSSQAILVVCTIWSVKPLVTSKWKHEQSKKGSSRLRHHVLIVLISSNSSCYDHPNFRRKDNLEFRTISLSLRYTKFTRQRRLTWAHNHTKAPN